MLPEQWRQIRIQIQGGIFRCYQPLNKIINFSSSLFLLRFVFFLLSSVVRPSAKTNRNPQWPRSQTISANQRTRILSSNIIYASDKRSIKIIIINMTIFRGSVLPFYGKRGKSWGNLRKQTGGENCKSGTKRSQQRLGWGRDSAYYFIIYQTWRKNPTVIIFLILLVTLNFLKTKTGNLAKKLS